MAGIASRRKADEVIAQGRVSINGEVVTEPWFRVDPQRHRVEVDGQGVRLSGGLVYVLLNKPAGYLTTVSDPWGRPTVLDLVKGVGKRIYPVGRLDLDTEGVLLLTNDGQLAHRLTHPRYEVVKVYRALVKGVPSQRDLELLSRGVRLEDGHVARAEVRLLERVGGEGLLELKLHEGRKRQVKRMLKAIGHPVRRLTRLEFAGLRVDGLQVGQWRHLTEEEVEGLKASVGLLPQGA